MRFIINGLKYETDNMEEVAEVRKWYRVNDFITNLMYPGKKMGRVHQCTLWKSRKGNWLLTHEEDYCKNYGEAIEEDEAKRLLMQYAPDKYEELFGEIPEA